MFFRRGENVSLVGLQEPVEAAEKRCSTAVSAAGKRKNDKKQE